MSTSYGFACPDHGEQTSPYLGRRASGRESLAAMWRARNVLALLHAEFAPHLVQGLDWVGFDSRSAAEEAEAFVVAHADCPVEIVTEYGDRELAADVGIPDPEPDADDVVRRVLTLLEFPADAVERTTTAIVDAIDAQRLLSWNRRPERLRR